MTSRQNRSFLRLAAVTIAMLALPAFAAEPDPSPKRWTTALLIEAAKKGDLQAVNAALAARVSPNGPPGRLTALHWVVAGGISDGQTVKQSPAIARRLIAAGADVNAKDYLGQTPLEWAASHGTPGLVKMLIDAGADVNAKSVYGTVLMAGSRPEIARLLIAAGADVNAGTVLTPLASAAKYGNVALIRLLIDSGAKVNDPRQPAIHWAQKPDVAKALIDAGARVDQRNRKGETALHLPSGAWVPTPETVKLLIDAGASVKAKTESGVTPLHAAIQRGNTEVAKLLIAAGAEVDARDEDCNTPLSLTRGALSQARRNPGADRKPYEAALRLLVDAGAKDDGRTRLQRAVEAGTLAEVTKQIAAGADLDAPGPQRITAAHIASEKGHAKILAALIEAGADVDRPDSQGMRPLHLAADAGIARALIAKGAKIASTPPSPLYMATANGRAGVVRELIRDPKAVKDAACAAMLNWAAFYGRVEVVKVLLARPGVKALLKTPGVYSPLHVAAGGSYGDMSSPRHVTPQHRLAIARLLVESGADVNVRWGNGVVAGSGAAHMIGATPLMFAAMKGEPGMVAFLLEKGAKVDARTRGEKTALDLARDADIKALLARKRNQVNFPP